MKAIATALKERSLEMFETALKKHKKGECFGTWYVICEIELTRSSQSRRPELQTDPLIRTHLAHLYDTLLEQNLVRVIEPYSTVELAYVAKQVGQPLSSVESKCVRFRSPCIPPS
jgi:26S proteasome regulatory subunit N6